MNWICEELIDVFWKQLLSPLSLMNWECYQFPSPTEMWFVMTSICKSLYMPCQELYRIIDQPYLTQCSKKFAGHSILVDMSIRSMVCEILERANKSKVGACVSNGFAAWKLERYIDASLGGEGWPFSNRTITFHKPANNDFWNIKDIDIYLQTFDSEASIDLIQNAFLKYSKRIWGEMYKCFWISSNHSDDNDCEDIDISSLDLSSIEKMHFRNQYKHAIHNKTTLKKMWSMCAGEFGDIFVPTTITVWSASDLSRIWQTSFFRHCGIKMVLKDGHWLYETSVYNFKALLHRKLVVQNSKRNKFYQKRTLMTYIENGFTFMGDDYFDVNYDVNLLRNLTLHQEIERIPPLTRC